MTAKRTIALAALLVAAYLILHVAGGRAATSALSGSAHGSGSLLFGVLYMLSYFGAVLLAPPLVLTAGAVAGLDALGAGTKGDAPLR